MMKKKWLLLTVTLLAGIALGLAMGRCHFMKHWGHRWGPEISEKKFDRMFNRFCGKLDLSPEQRAEIKPILASFRDEMEEKRQTRKAQWKQGRQEIKKKILPLLTEEQKVTLEKMEERWENRKSKFCRRCSSH